MKLLENRQFHLSNNETPSSIFASNRYMLRNNAEGTSMLQRVLSITIYDDIFF